MRKQNSRSTPADERHLLQVSVDPVTGCWNWTGSDVAELGYARFKVGGKRVLVHRWSYAHYVGPIPDGMVIDHLCDNPRCSNPEHLSVTTQRHNTTRSLRNRVGQNIAKTHCPYGHPFDEKNTGLDHNGTRPKRRCLTCHREKETVRREAKRAARRAG